MPNLNMPGAAGRPHMQPMMPRGGGGGLTKYIITLLVLAVVGGGGYYFYQQGMIPFLQKKAPPPPPPVEVLPPPQDVTTPPQEIPPAPTSLPPATQPPETKPMGTGEFTVVIHSFMVRATADDVASQWSGAGFPTMVTERNSEGSTWYCVSVGRYETRQLAQKAGKDMEHMLETGYWVDRVR